MKKTLLISLLTLALAGCSSGSDDSNVVVGAAGGGGGGGGGGGNVQPQTVVFDFPNFPPAGQVTLVSNFQPPGETSSITAQVTAAVEQDPILGLARAVVGRAEGLSPGAALHDPCGSSAVSGLTRLMGEPIRPQIQARAQVQAQPQTQLQSQVQAQASDIRARFEELPEGAQEEFFLITAFQNVTAEKVLEPNETEHCTIFAELDDLGNPCISRSKALAIAEAFDSNNPARPGSGIYDQARDAFGSEWNQNPPGGNDGDMKIVIFFFRSETLGSNLFGYTSPVDQSPNDSDLSNHAEIVYINADKDNLQTLSTLAHEFQHLINQNEKVVQQGTFPEGAQDENVTINEGLSTLCEEICGFTLDNGNTLMLDVCNDYLARPQAHEFFDFFAAGVGYGEGYLFFKYVREQFGDQMIHDIVANPLVGKANLDAHLPPGFDEVFRRWTVANYATNLGSGVPEIYRYPSGFRTNGTYDAGTLVGVDTQPMASNRTNESPALGAWSTAYLSYTGGDGSDLRLTVQTAPGSPVGAVYEAIQGTFTQFQDD